MFTSRLSRLVLAVAVAASMSALGSCGASSPTTVCAPNLFLFKGGCTTAAGQSYGTCIQDRGQDLTTEERAKIEAAVDVGFKGGSTVVDLSRKTVETELPEVAKQVVADCLELSRGAATPAERQGIDNLLKDLEGTLKSLAVGTIVLDPDHGPYEQKITITGTDWPANTDMKIDFQMTTIDVTTNKNGRFKKVIHLDPKFAGMGSSIQIRAAPKDPSMVFPDEATYQVDG